MIFLLAFILISLIILTVSVVGSTNNYCEVDDVDCKDYDYVDKDRHLHKYKERKVVHVGVVACGDRYNEVITMMKSVMFITEHNVLFHLFTDDGLKSKFIKKFSEYEHHFSGKFYYKIYPIQYPSVVEELEWKKLYKPCATQRIFIPVVLSSIDSIIYMDTDVLFLNPIEKLWAKFENFNKTQVSSMTMEHEEPSAGWYNRFARHPYVLPYGINSGIMLMNLTRMRQTTWLDDMITYHEKYKYDITWGDQDLINIYFHFHPEELHVIPCNWNYRPDHCMYMSTCRSAEEDGVFIAHGNRRVFHNDNMPTFKALYESISDFPVEKWNSLAELKYVLTNKLNHDKDTKCGSINHLFVKNYFTYLT